MAEVLAAFSAVASFFQLVDFTAKVISTTRELLHTGADALRENVDTAHLTREYEVLVADVASSSLSAPGDISRLADECQHCARKLIAELDQLRLDIRGSKAKRVIHGTQMVVRTMRRRKEIEKARRTLQEMNGLLSTALLKDIWIRNQPLAAAHMTDPCLSDVRNVQQVRLILARKSIGGILDSLRYASITARYEALEPAWRHTYEWALRDDTLGYRTWLQEGSGVYWITGKAGSGKSTLMKFLCDAKETSKLLMGWAGQRELVFAKFFFWYAGTPVQKSIDGLLRSILYQLLYAAPSLARIAFPRLTSTNDSAPGQWTYAQLVTGLKNIAQYGQLASAESQNSFCFFIDGLDEYQGNHSELTKLVLELANSPYVKICVSSRPWNAFQSAFECRVPNLKLEQLSRQDIQHYASERIDEANRLHHSSDSSDVEKMTAVVDEIVTRSEGVFL